LLTTIALCDAAEAEIDSEITDVKHQQDNYAYSKGKASERAEEVNQEIATLDSDIAKYNADIPGMTPGSKNRLKREAELRTAVKRRGDLGALLQSNTQGPVGAYRVAVNLRQVVKSLEVLNEAKADIIAHRDTLTA
jgi:hypothetical protein